MECRSDRMPFDCSRMRAVVVVASRRMSDLTLEIPTTKTGMEEIRAVLDAALAKEFPGGMLRRNWAGETLELSGPGAKGTITFEDGKLVGRASLGPPASMMRGMIEQKIGTAMRTAAA